MPRSPRTSESESDSESENSHDYLQLESHTDSESDSANAGAKRKRAMKSALNVQRKRKKSRQILKSYIKFSDWYHRSENMYINWHLVIETGLDYANEQYGALTAEKYLEVHARNLAVYNTFVTSVSKFENDLEAIELHSDGIMFLTKAMQEAASSARSADIFSLKDRILVYVAMDKANKQLDPQLLPNDSKKKRGFKHIDLARLICPIVYKEEFERNPIEFSRELASGRRPVRSHDLPAFIWKEGEHDPEDWEHKMFQSPLLLRVFKHLFTSPSSALSNEVGASKSSRSQARIHGMKSVTLPSIAYTCAMVRYALSVVDDFRNDDKIFKIKDFYRFLLKDFLNEKENPILVQTTINWYNVHVFGTSPVIDPGDEVPGGVQSSADIFRQQQEAKKARAAARASETDLSAQSTTPSPIPASTLPAHPSLPLSLHSQISTRLASPPIDPQLLFAPDLSQPGSANPESRRLSDASQPSQQEGSHSRPARRRVSALPSSGHALTPENQAGPGGQYPPAYYTGHH
ncbi:hypothetical protein CVT24_009969 [Panaeolus cyanescens]|uniref:Uncharacterized protein n=1 Tax=Panaeolus cyanescens TaxID=181874 RepID=A0A409W3Z9_9AGAR|nr:hypothetical protein CVT24_009969 [Panaeolus cyanescens]